MWRTQQLTIRACNADCEWKRTYTDGHRSRWINTTSLSNRVDPTSGYFSHASWRRRADGHTTSDPGPHAFADLRPSHSRTNPSTDPSGNPIIVNQGGPFRVDSGEA